MNDAAITFKKTIEAYLPMIGQAAVIPHIEVEEDDENMTSFTLGEMGVFVTVGHPVETTSILGPKTSLGYRVGYWKTYNNYPHAPDDVEDVTYAEHLGIRDTLASVGALFARDAADNCVPTY